MSNTPKNNDFSNALQDIINSLRDKEPLDVVNQDEETNIEFREQNIIPDIHPKTSRTVDDLMTSVLKDWLNSAQGQEILTNILTTIIERVARDEIRQFNILDLVRKIVTEHLMKS